MRSEIFCANSKNGGGGSGRGGSGRGVRVDVNRKVKFL